MIDRYHLRYFLAVIDQGNFSKAAIACNVSQPTLSVGISKLEAQLGKPLFNRTNRRVELTEAGAHLAGYARRIEETFVLAERDVEGTTLASTVRIGILSSTPSSWTEAFIRDHRAGGTGERVELIEGRERDLLDHLARGGIDVALTIIRDDLRRYETNSLFSEGYSLALSSTHPLAGRTSIRAEELINESMIARRHCEVLSQTSKHFTARGVRPFFPARTTSEDRAMSYVRAGLGLTVMPDCFTSPGVSRPALEDFSHVREIGLVYGLHVDVNEARIGGPARRLANTVERLRRG